MKTYPLKSITIEQAKEKQFCLIDEICKEFTGTEFLSLGDLGVVAGLNKPRTTEKVQKVLAHYFHAEKCVLVTGAGTGAIRSALTALIQSQDMVLIHRAPVYPTTLVTLKAMGCQLVEADYNNLEEVKRVVIEHDIACAIVQYTRQKPSDCYDIQEVIAAICSVKEIPIITDDNYAAMKVDKIGVELGSACSAFSAFKLLGPEGIGILVGKAEIIEAVERMNYSGGGQVQGWQAMEVLRGLVYAPVSLAIQAEVSERLVQRLRCHEIPEVQNVFLANAQSKVILVEFQENIAERVLMEAQKLGAAPNPIGAESKYELVPMFYRVSGTFLKADPTLKERMIRINPMRAGDETVIRILKESIKRVQACL